MILYVVTASHRALKNPPKRLKIRGLRLIHAISPAFMPLFPPHKGKIREMKMGKKYYSAWRLLLLAVEPPSGVIKMINVKWIFFDIGSTLIDESECYKLRSFEAVAGTTISVEDFWKKTLEFSKLNLKGDHEAAKYYGIKLPPWHKDAEKPYANAESVLEHLSVKGYHLGVIANQSLGTKDRLSNWGLLKFFDIVLASAEEGVAKPDLEIFKRALAKAGCLPKEAYMIGDRLDNDIEPAAKLGMRTIWVKQGLGAYGELSLIHHKPEFIVEHIEDVLEYL